MPAEGPRYLYMEWAIKDDELDTIQPFYRVSRKHRELLLSDCQDHGWTQEIIRPDLLENGKVDLRSTPGVKVAQL